MDTVASRDGTRIAFETSGAGPALLLVTGALSDRSVALTVRAALDAHFTLFAYDRRGRGDSGDTAPCAPERELEDLGAVLDVAGSGAFVYGHSSGAILSLRAAMSGQSMGKLAVMEPPFIVPGMRPLPPADVTSRLTSLVAAGDRAGALRVFLTEQVGIPAAAVSQMAASPLWARMLKLAHTVPYDSAIASTGELPAALARVAIPTLLLHGGRSFPWIGETARTIAKTIPGAEFAVLEGQDHSPAPEVLAPALVRFFLG